MGHELRICFTGYKVHKYDFYSIEQRLKNKPYGPYFSFDVYVHPDGNEFLDKRFQEIKRLSEPRKRAIKACISIYKLTGEYVWVAESK